MRVAILGGTSHLARALAPYGVAAGASLTLFARNPETLAGGDCRVETGFDGFCDGDFDLVINCIGAGSPGKLHNDYLPWFTVLEAFDNLCLRYLQEKNPNALYVHFSSGAVYGGQGGAAERDSACRLSPNAVAVSDYYRLAKLYAEAKHRAYADLRIADIRIFSFFSRHADLSAGYFMTDAAKALLSGEVLRTSPSEMVRDYIHPSDLWRLVRTCAAMKKINLAVDAASAAPVGKLELLDELQRRFGLRSMFDDARRTTPNATSDCYYSCYRQDWQPQPEYTSLDSVCGELRALLAARGR